MNAMKRIVNLMALAFAAASTVSCISEIAEPVQEMVKDENLELKELVFSASFEGRESDDDTKTALVNGREVYWLPGDQIALCDVEEPFTCTATEPTPITEFVGLAGLEREGEESAVGEIKFANNEEAFDYACDAFKALF